MNVRILAVKGCLDTIRSLHLMPAVSTMSQRCLQSTSTLPVVAGKMPYRVKVSAGKKYAWCACGHSQKQPFCDGAHRTKAPSIAPLRFTPDKDMAVMLCACKQTHNAPYCDGTHFKVIFRGLVNSAKKLFGR